MRKIVLRMTPGEFAVLLTLSFFTGYLAAAVLATRWWLP